MIRLMTLTQRRLGILQASNFTRVKTLKYILLLQKTCRSTTEQLPFVFITRITISSVLTLFKEIFRGTFYCFYPIHDIFQPERLSGNISLAFNLVNSDYTTPIKRLDTPHFRVVLHIKFSLLGQLVSVFRGKIVTIRMTQV